MEKILITVCLLCLSCSNSERLNEVEEIQFLLNVDSKTTIYAQCSYTTNKAYLKITNKSESDTILIIKPNKELSDCYHDEKILRYVQKNDSLILESFAHGDFWGKPTIDTIIPNREKIYAVDLDGINNLFYSNISHVQLYYPYQVANNEKKESFFKLLLFYDKKNDVIRQMNFTVPEGIERFFIK